MEQKTATKETNPSRNNFGMQKILISPVIFKYAKWQTLKTSPSCLNPLIAKLTNKCKGIWKGSSQRKVGLNAHSVLLLTISVTLSASLRWNYILLVKIKETWEKFDPGPYLSCSAHEWQPLNNPHRSFPLEIHDAKAVRVSQKENIFTPWYPYHNQRSPSGCQATRYSKEVKMFSFSLTNIKIIKISK